MAQEYKQVVITEIKQDTTQAVSASKSLEDQQEKTADSTEKNTEATQDYSGALDGMVDQLGLLPPGMAKGVKGAANLTKGFKGLKAAIIATGIGALIIVLSSLFAWFNRTEEGADKLSLIMAFLGQIVDGLMDGFADLGGAMFEAFTNPKQAIADLWEAIKKNLLNRLTSIVDQFKAVGKIIESVFNLDWDGMKEGAADYGWAMQQMITGIDKETLTNMIDNTIEKQKESYKLAQAAVALQARQNALEVEQIANIVVEAELRTQIANSRLKANQASLGALAQLEASNNALRLTNDMFDERIRLATEEVAILEARQELGHNTREDNREMAQATAALIELEKQRDDQLRSITTKNETLLSTIKKQREEETAINTVLVDRQDILVQKNKEAQDQMTQDNFDALQIRNANALKAHDQEKERIESIAEFEKDIQMQTFEAISQMLHMFSSENKALAVTQILVSSAIALMKMWEGGFATGILGSIVVGTATIKALSDVAKAERGMMIMGKSHAQGGTLIEAEKGEAIINKRSMSNPYLRSLASEINQWGGGIAFAQNGLLVGQNSSTLAINSMNRDIQRAFSEMAPVMILEDFHTAQSRVIVKENLSRLAG